MATPASTEASEIRRRGRQRLIGAVALVILLVVFVPMLLDSEPRPPRPQPAIPARQGAPALPAPLPAAAPATSASSPATATVTPSAPAAGVKPSPAPATARVDPGPSQAPGTEATSPPPRLVGFAVQVGAFRDEAKLNQARDKLAGASIPHYTERLEAQGGPLTRLRAGPFATREAAESAQVVLKRAALDGKVVPLP